MPWHQLMKVVGMGRYRGAVRVVVVGGGGVVGVVVLSLLLGFGIVPMNVAGIVAGAGISVVRVWWLVVRGRAGVRVTRGLRTKVAALAEWLALQPAAQLVLVSDADVQAPSCERHEGWGSSC